MKFNKYKKGLACALGLNFLSVLFDQSFLLILDSAAEAQHIHFKACLTDINSRLPTIAKAAKIFVSKMGTGFFFLVAYILAQKMPCNACFHFVEMNKENVVSLANTLFSCL